MNTKIKNSKRLDILGNGNLLSNREILTAFLKRFRQRLGYFSLFATFPAILTSLPQETQAEEAKKTEMLPAGQNVRFLERLNKSCSKPKFLRSRSNNRLPFETGIDNIISELAGGDDCPGTAIPGGVYPVASPFTDSGNTTGANNTVSTLCIPYYCYDYHTAYGPDQIYTFQLTHRGANPQIQVSATSATYTPMIYILHGNIFPGCPAGANHGVNNWITRSYSPSPGGTAILQMNSLPLNTPLYLFVDSESNGANGSGPYTLRMQDVIVAPATSPGKRFDFDGDGKADIAVFRDGIWYWLNSSNGNFRAIQFGLAGDIPQPADFDGNGRAELAVYRGGVWHTLNLVNNQSLTFQFGLPTDKPVAADYDGDGAADYAVYRDGVWYLNQSAQGFAAIQFGLSTDRLVPADYDNDGKTDLAVYRDGTWYLRGSLTGLRAFQWGIASDIPAPADYNGDGAADAAVFRDGTWYLLQSGNAISTRQFGSPNDKPVPAAYLP